jgi:prevent-host-death family protein
MQRTVVSLSEARARLSSLLEAVESGAEIVITKHGKPAACLVPVTHKPGRRQLALISGRLEDSFFEPLPPDVLSAWECAGNVIHRT